MQIPNLELDITAYSNTFKLNVGVLSSTLKVRIMYFLHDYKTNFVFQFNERKLILYKLRFVKIG